MVDAQRHSTRYVNTCDVLLQTPKYRHDPFADAYNQVMTGMPVAVDAFRYGAIPKVTAYLLTCVIRVHTLDWTTIWVDANVHVVTLIPTITPTCPKPGTTVRFTVPRRRRISSFICWAWNRNGLYVLLPPLLCSPQPACGSCTHSTVSQMTYRSRCPIRAV